MTLSNLHSALTTTHQCSTCTDFGAFLSLFSCTRTCFLCATRSNPLRPESGTPSTSPLQTPSAASKLSRGNTPSQNQTRQYTPQNENDTPLSIVARQSPQASDSTGRCGKCSLWWYPANGNYAPNYAAKIIKSRRACLALVYVPIDRKSDNPHRFMGLVRGPWIDPQTRATVEWRVFCKACSPYLTKDVITLLTDEDPCLHCEGCKKCDYRHLGGTGGCDGGVSGKCKHSDGRRMF